MKKGVAFSLCSAGEKPLLDEIRRFLNKELEVIPIDREDYVGIPELSGGENDLRAMILEHEARLRKKGKRKSPPGS